MSEPRTINLPGSGADTQSYELAPGLLQYVQAVYVTVDNSAGGDARPTLTLSEQSGVVIAKKRQGEAIAAGDTGSATWALRLTDERTGAGGIQFDTLNSGGWLFVDATGTGGPDSAGIDLIASGGPIDLTDSNGLNIRSNGIAITCAGGLSESYQGNWSASFGDGGGSTVNIFGEFDILVSGGIIVLNTDTSPIRIVVGFKTFEFWDDGTIHGPTGGSLIFDL